MKLMPAGSSVRSFEKDACNEEESIARPAVGHV